MMSDKKVKDPELHRRDKEKKTDFETQAKENLAGWQKALADYQNLHKEMDKKLSSMNDFVSASMILELLPIFDNYQVAITHIPEDQKKESWAVGLEHILKMWESFLQDHGVIRIETVGNQFDPHLHESVGQVVKEDKDDQAIVEEKLAGYKLQDKIIRPAKVIINNN